MFDHSISCKYKENQYILALLSVCVQYNYRNRGSLTFEPLTLVPIQVKMMNTELLTQKEVRNIQSDYVSYFK